MPPVSKRRATIPVACGGEVSFPPASQRSTLCLPLKRIVSGGQTGVDRAALDAARECGLSLGGWCPRGRRAEDGTIPACYPLLETPSRDYRERTRWNVRDSDATLILVAGPLTGGTALTFRMAGRLRRPVLVCDLNEPDAALLAKARWWVDQHGVRVLNVAGPRASQQAGLVARAGGFLRNLLAGEKLVKGVS